MKTVLAVLVVALLAGAYLLGSLPERRRRAELEQRVQALEAELADARARERVTVLLARLLALVDMVERKNYGESLPLSTSFFDAVRDEASRTSDAAVREALLAIQARRDAVTARLSLGDPAAADVLGEAQTRLQTLLGPPPSPAAVPGATPPVEAPGGSRPPATEPAPTLPPTVTSPAATPSPTATPLQVPPPTTTPEPSVPTSSPSPTPPGSAGGGEPGRTTPLLP
jgi:hypothetical protein